MAKMASTKELRKIRVMGGKKRTKKIGKVRDCVFHPTQRRCIGLTVRRPDFLWMFHRKDWFIPLGGFDFQDGRIVIKPGVQTNGAAACKEMGISWDDCIIWDGMPMMTDADNTLGRVGSIAFDLETGEVESVVATNGYAAQYLLGELTVPAEMILGFRRGIGDDLLVKNDSRDLGEEYSYKGAIMVSEDVWSLEPEGGWAASAGEFTAKAAARAKEIGANAEEKFDEVAHNASESVQKGAYITGKQVASTKGMFSSFKEEYEAARDGEITDVGEKVEKESSSKSMFAAFKEEYQKARDGVEDDDEYEEDEYEDEEEYEDDDLEEYEEDEYDEEDDDEYEDDDEDDEDDEEEEDLSDMLKRAVSSERIGGMFSAFKEEYNKAKNGEE